MKVKAGPLTVHVRGGTDGKGGGDGPSIVLCHGFGAPGDDLVDLAEIAPIADGVRWFFPEAPRTVDVGMGLGRAWWELDLVRLQELLMRGQRHLLIDETPDGLEAARQALMEALEALERDFGLNRRRTVIGGFSQGAMITTDVALMSDVGSFAGLGIFSGTIVSADRWRERAAKVGKGLHVAQSHGSHDPLLPISIAEQLRDVLIENGADVTFTPFRGQHEIPPPALRAFVVLASSRLSDERGV